MISYQGLDAIQNKSRLDVFLIMDGAKLRATSHMRMCDHCILRSLIGRKGQDHPSSLHTRRWRPKGPKNLSWMTSPHGFPHDKLWMMFHNQPKFASSPAPINRHDANTSWPCQWYGLWMRKKGPHKYMVTTLGLSEKWSLVGQSSSSQTNDKA